jgi:Zn-dependent peptidase ImmA (M78 family)
MKKRRDDMFEEISINVEGGEAMAASEIRARAEQDAWTVIEQSWDSSELPINPIAIAKKMGIEVYEANLPGNVSGLLKKEIGGSPEIYLDREDHVRRRRFTCAHELGHFIQRQSEASLAFVDRRDGVSSEGTNDDEIYANAFAAALLMPKPSLRMLLNSGFSELQMAAHLSVSSESLHYRLKNLGYTEQPA